MKAPEKLYMHQTASGNVGASWLSFPLTDNDIEYTRTDAFIKRACEWLESVNLDYYQIREGVFSRELVDDFRKAMKGE